MRLKGKVVVVTGASRGVGRGIAVALGAEGATVYLSGRTMDAAGEGLGGSLRQTAEEIDARGGRGVPVRCDHGVDEDVQALFACVESEQGRCDILVNTSSRTERVLAGELPFGTEVSESPEFTGRAIAALFADPKRMDKTGRVHVVTELAEEYGFDDVDGTRPPSLRQLSREKKSAKETR